MKTGGCLCVFYCYDTQLSLYEYDDLEIRDTSLLQFLAFIW